MHSPTTFLRSARIVICAAICLAVPYGAAEAGGLRLTGEMRMGLVRDTGTARTGVIPQPSPRWRFDTGYRLRLHAGGRTDGGLEFGAVLDLDSEDLDRRRRR